jgi:hypothetical protein
MRRGNEFLDGLTADRHGNEPECKLSAVSYQQSAKNKKLKAGG